MDTSKMRRDEAMEIRRAEVMELRVQGHSVRAIAAILGRPASTVASDVKKIFDRLRKEQYANAEHLRDLTAQQYEEQLKNWWPRSLDDLGALDKVVRLLRERAKLFGLYEFPEAPPPPPSAVTVNFVGPRETGYTDTDTDTDSEE